MVEGRNNLLIIISKIVLTQVTTLGSVDDINIANTDS
jgi:hypothetical protein